MPVICWLREMSLRVMVCWSLLPTFLVVDDVTVGLLPRAAATVRQQESRLSLVGWCSSRESIEYSETIVTLEIFSIHVVGQQS
jgi:hypothetical protein